jgi:DNA polymerase III delta prime subunit
MSASAKDRDKIRRIFRFLQELHQVKSPPLVDMALYDWKVSYDAVPRYPSVQRGDTNSGFVIKVARPAESACPKPSIAIDKWLKSGWEQFGVEPELYPRRQRTNVEGEEITELFDESPERVEAFEKWEDQKHAWEKSEKSLRDALNVFLDLFDLYGKFERESETFQLFVADGILRIKKPDGLIHHPILLQRVELVFNPSVPEFLIKESPQGPELYTPLLRYAGIDGKAIQQLRDQITRDSVHPLDTDATSEFFKSFIHKFWPDGLYGESIAKIESDDVPCIYRGPFFFLGYRGQGYFEALESYIQKLPGLDGLPEALLRLVGREKSASEQAAKNGGGAAAHSIDLLLTKHANPEQQRVIQELETKDTVMVQGPPGTGKTHTIANLIGHLLAKRQRILVTSHASKALRVVKDLVAPSLRPLCVSVLHGDEDSSKELEESITGIINYLAKTSVAKLDAEILQIDSERVELVKESDQLRQKLRESALVEYRRVDFDGEQVLPAELGRRLAREREQHGWIPGAVSGSSKCPLSEQEIKKLYRTNFQLTDEDNALLSGPLPGLDQLPSAKEFIRYFDEFKTLDKKIPEESKQYWERDAVSVVALERLKHHLADALEGVELDARWFMACLQAGGERGDRADSWLELIDLIKTSRDQIGKKEKLVIRLGPSIQSALPAQDQIRILQEIIQHLKSPKKFKKLTSLFHPEWSKLAQEAKTDQGELKEIEHFEAVLHLVEIRLMRDNLCKRWDRQMEGLAAPGSQAMGPKPEETMSAYGVKLEKAVKWMDDRWGALKTEMAEVGLKWEMLFHRLPLQPQQVAEAARIVHLIRDQLIPLTGKQVENLELKDMKGKRGQWLSTIRAVEPTDASRALLKTLEQAFKAMDYDAYDKAWKRLGRVLELKPAFEERNKLLQTLSEAAPRWAEAIADRESPHDTAEIPGSLNKAWTHLQLAQKLISLGGSNIEKLEDRLALITEKVQKVNAMYVEKLAWRAQVERTGLKQQQALNGWLGLYRKIGKGTGKLVGKFKEEARKILLECHQAVPVWIMPLSGALESFELGTTHFDVIIIDEASQCDVLGLAAFALGKKIVVIGDHEQVSPYAVGFETNRVQGLVEEFLDEIPNKQLYDGKTSVYDLARQAFGGIVRLIEHFRCVPEIIEFSNQLCYGGEILPLREASTSQVYPHLIGHRVRSASSENRTNEVEALEVASLIMAMCRLEEFEGCTVGAICMVGTEQAVKIDSILRRRLSAAEYRRRRILCGNASQFQGDERDVIFLSLVDTARKGEVLTLRSSDEWKRVYNVAASRARDQLWVVYSMDPQRDLKKGDLRLRLISHVEQHAAEPKNGQRPSVKFESAFEKSLNEKLIELGYSAQPKYRVGEFEVDFMIQGDAGTKAVISCDGDRIVSEASVLSRMERQLTLERLGWNFIHLRASDYLGDEPRAMRRLTRKLTSLKIEPMAEKPVDAAPKAPREDLREKIIKRAEMIRGRLTNGDKDKAPPRAPERTRRVPAADKAPALRH